MFFFKFLFLIFSSIAVYGVINDFWLATYSFTLFASFVADILYLNYYIDKNNVIPKFAFTFFITLITFTLMSFTSFLIMIFNNNFELVFLTGIAFSCGIFLLTCLSFYLYPKNKKTI